jgi:hypothetical protein
MKGHSSPYAISKPCGKTTSSFWKVKATTTELFTYSDPTPPSSKTSPETSLTTGWKFKKGKVLKEQEIFT